MFGGSLITIDGIVYVIDSGLELLSYFDYIKYMQIIEKRYTTKAQIKQRMGRAGRTQPGVCYHLYTKDTYESLEEYPKPAIALANMNDNFLSFVRYKKYFSDALELCKNLITPVSPIQIMSAVRFLHFNNLIKLVDQSQSQKGGDDESGAFEFGESQTTDVIDEFANATTLSFKDIPYKKMTSYESWKTYQGGLTRFGKIIQDLNGYPIELCMMGFYGKLLNLPSIYSMTSIMAAMDFKLDNLIRFPPNMQQTDKQKFVNENFPDAVVNYSEHLFIYNLLTNYYELGNKLELLKCSNI